ncbi:proQ/FINO family protein, partial [Escherichia coli]|nr:proQ/FINO family protein [Escherichia coli]
MTKLTINRKPKGIYGTPQKTTQAAQEQDKTTSAHKVMPGNQKAQQKLTGATSWRHMTKRQRKNRR